MHRRNQFGPLQACLFWWITEDGRTCTSLDLVQDDCGLATNGQLQNSSSSVASYGALLQVGSNFWTPQAKQRSQRTAVRPGRCPTTTPLPNDLSPQPWTSGDGKQRSNSP